MRRGKSKWIYAQRFQKVRTNEVFFFLLLQPCANGCRKGKQGATAAGEDGKKQEADRRFKRENKPEVPQSTTYRHQPEVFRSKKRQRDANVTSDTRAFPLQGSELLCNHADHRMRWEAAKQMRVSSRSASEADAFSMASHHLNPRKRPELRGEELSPVLGPCSQLFALIESLKQKEEET
ncbi:hypothetical protein CSPX01_06601 [Colletotrichum filicis]|nr:hypothetical protein CSPX01_06601 [Colletotrichum filicis]